jgi:conjugal transfer pilus assembly protein TraD
VGVAAADCGDRRARGRRGDDGGAKAMTGTAGLVTSGVLVALVFAVVLALRSHLGAGQRTDAEYETVIGDRRDGRARSPVGLSRQELQQGLLIGGSPGAGKTTLLVGLVREAPRGVGVAFIDLKGDRSLAERLAVSEDNVFGLDDRGAASWSPLADGNPASWRDILMAAEEWTEPHYRRAAARYVGAALAALNQLHGRVELDAAIGLLEQPKGAAGLVRKLHGRERAALASAARAIEVDGSLRSGVLGLGNRLALLRDSPATAGRFGAPGGIDLAGVLRGERVLFSLPAAEFPDEAPAIAAAAIQALGAAGQRLAAGDEALRALLVVDEAPRLEGHQLREAVAIGRGAGVGAIVAVQDFADLDYVAPGTREAVETGANTWIVMRQVASAERIADALGTRTALKQTVQRDRRRLLSSDTGLRSEREVEQYRVSPNVIRSLGRGEAIVWRRLRGTVDRVEVRGLEGVRRAGARLAVRRGSERSWVVSAVGRGAGRS